MRPLVSVIIPTYNRRQWVMQAIESVLTQTMSDREIIVVDDGSSDGTAEALLRYKRRIRQVRRTNGGPAAARNYGTMIALGEWISFLDSDDEWGPRTLESHIHGVATHPKSNVHLVNAQLQREESGTVNMFEYTGFAPHCRDVIERPLSLQIRYGMAWPQCALIRRRTFEHVGGFDERFRVLYEDFDLFCRLATQGPWSFDTHPHVRIMRRTGDHDMISQHRLNDPVGIAHAMVTVYTKLLARDDLHAEERGLAKQQLKLYRRGWGMALLRHGDRREARQVFAHSYHESGDSADALRYMITFLPRGLIDSAARAHAHRNLLRQEDNGTHDNQTE